MDATQNIILEVCVGLTKNADMFLRNYLTKCEMFCLNIVVVIGGGHYGAILGGVFLGLSRIGMAWGALVGSILGLVMVYSMDLDLKRAFEVLEEELTPGEKRLLLVYVMEFFDRRRLVDSQTTLRELKKKPNHRYQILHRIALFLTLERRYKVYFTHERREVTI